LAIDEQMTSFSKKAFDNFSNGSVGLLSDKLSNFFLEALIDN
jgi:hypothetical protein